MVVDGIEQKAGPRDRGDRREEGGNDANELAHYRGRHYGRGCVVQGAPSVKCKACSISVILFLKSKTRHRLVSNSGGFYFY